MKYRDYKVSAPGVCFHVFNRGNGRMDIFRDHQDYNNFLKRLWIALNKLQGAPSRMTPCGEGDFSLLCFCLMPNHFHLQIRQNRDTPVGKLLLKVCTSYSMYFNKKYKHVGHVFQDQFKAIPIENDNQLVALSAYIHQNPKIAGLVNNLKDWPFSSYPQYAGLRSGNADSNDILSQFRDQEDYKTFVDERYQDINELKEIER